MLGGRGSEVRDSTALLEGADASERHDVPLLRAEVRALLSEAHAMKLRPRMDVG